MTLPTNDVSKVYEDASKIAKDFYDGGTTYTSVIAKTNGLPGTHFHTADSREYTEFSKDYRIFVFDAKDSGGTPPWQSGKCYGVVVSKNRNEVIYYAENW
jgi:hypothetical protein